MRNFLYVSILVISPLLILSFIPYKQGTESVNQTLKYLEDNTDLNCKLVGNSILANILSTRDFRYNIICLAPAPNLNPPFGTSKGEYSGLAYYKYSKSIAESLDTSKRDVTIGVKFKTAKRLLTCHFPEFGKNAWKLCTRFTGMGCSKANCSYDIDFDFPYKYFDTMN